jgi:hypothetical protein
MPAGRSAAQYSQRNYRYVIVCWKKCYLAGVLISVAGLVGGCSSPLSKAGLVPACRLFNPAQTRLVLASPNVQLDESRVGYCAESGLGEGSRVTHLTVQVYKGADAAKVPRGTGVHYGWYPNEVVPYSPGKHVEGYWIPLTPTTITPPGTLQSGILSAAKDGYVVRAWVTDAPNALGELVNAVGLVLAQV